MLARVASLSWLDVRVRTAVAAAVLVAPFAAHAESSETAKSTHSDEHVLTVHGETHAQLFRRAPLPGPGGAIVETETAVPIEQTVLLRAEDIDTPFDRDAVDIELAAWALVAPAGGPSDRAADGDVQTAWVSYRRGPVSVRLGRQHVAGGAARYARFDGAELQGDLGAGFAAAAYGGQTVLPRWNARPGYHLLGGRADELLETPDALPPPKRAGYWLTGGRVGWAAQERSVSTSFHEERERGGIARRTAGIDGRAAIGDAVRVGGSALLELDALRSSDARIWLGATPIPWADLEAEVRHVEPSLLLSQQSIFSVFSTDGYDEAGVVASFQLLPRLGLDGAAYIDRYASGGPGGRSELALRLTAGRARRTLVRVAHTRLQAPENGYHALRASLSHALLPRLTGTVEAYSYLYDAAVRGHRISTLHVATIGHRIRQGLEALAFASIARSPYASLDAQAGLRLSVDFDFTSRRGRP